jgi:hypothetical protein
VPSLCEEGEPTTVEGKADRLRAIDTLLEAMKERLRKEEARVKQVPCIQRAKTPPAARDFEPPMPFPVGHMGGHMKL